MAVLPAGTVTFLFTDIEGSTTLLQRLGDRRYAAILADHQRLLRHAFAAGDGQEIDTQGDAFLVAFSRARDAVAGAVAAQQAIIRHPWPEGVSLRVRMGLHTGEPLSRGTGYVGMDVHRAARICSAGHGGQILLSHAVEVLAAPDLPSGTSTVLLWSAFVANLLATSFLVSWLPTLVNSTGIPVREAVWSNVVYLTGGIVGPVILGKLIDLYGPYRVLSVNFLTGATLLSLAGLAGSSLPLILTLSLGIGLCIPTGQTGLNALAGGYYPTYIRSTGAGWAHGIGRSGTVLSGLLGTLLLGWRWSLPMIFLAIGFFALCAATAIQLIGMSQWRKVGVPSGAGSTG